MLSACGNKVDENAAINIMQQEGWEFVQVVHTGFRFPHPFAPVRACSNQDDEGFYILGLNPAGKRDSATVCCRPGKPCTIVK